MYSRVHFECLLGLERFGLLRWRPGEDTVPYLGHVSVRGSDM
jgi:hypothetical protein